MTKLQKKLLIIIICLSIICSCIFTLKSFATESDLDENDAVTTSAEDDGGNETVIHETTKGSASSLTPSSTTSVSSMNTYQEANLDLNNILSIILIAVGVVIILLAIAILLKLR